MRYYTIDGENNIAVHASRKAARETGGEVFSTEERFADLIGPDDKRLVEIWNRLPGINAMAKSANRKIATECVWKAIQALRGPVSNGHLPRSGLDLDDWLQAERELRRGLIPPLCLALTCLSKPAAAITIGPADGKVTCDRTTCSSDTKLPAGPGPGGGGVPINPNDYGMCGLLHLSGTFDSSTVARIIVGADGYYHVHRAWSTIRTTFSAPQAAHVQ